MSRPELRARVRTPAGLDLGAGTPEEVALSILAEIVSARHARDELRGDQAASPRSEHPVSSSPALTRDPVCGMPVAAAAASPHVETPAGRVWFCGTGCRTAYVDNPAAYPS